MPGQTEQSGEKGLGKKGGQELNDLSGWAPEIMCVEPCRCHGWKTGQEQGTGKVWVLEVYCIQHKDNLSSTLSWDYRVMTSRKSWGYWGVWLLKVLLTLLCQRCFYCTKAVWRPIDFETWPGSVQWVSLKNWVIITNRWCQSADWRRCAASGRACQWQKAQTGHDHDSRRLTVTATLFHVFICLALKRSSHLATLP